MHLCKSLACFRTRGRVAALLPSLEFVARACNVALTCGEAGPEAGTLHLICGKLRLQRLLPSL